MNHNDIFRRLRFALQINDTASIQLFKSVGYEMEGPYQSGLMKKEQEDGFIPCRDKILSLFLDALIVSRRGAKEGQQPKQLGPGEILTNNEILRKIRIAMELKDSDIIALLKLAHFNIGKSELSAFFRKPEHRNYKECGDQLLRNLLKGMTIKYRPDIDKKPRTGAKAAHPSQATTKPKTEKKATHKPKDAAPAAKLPTPQPQEPRESVWGPVKSK